MKHKIRLIAFDGKIFWKVCSLEIIDDKEIYYAIPSLNYSISRHGSGKIHHKCGIKGGVQEKISYSQEDGEKGITKRVDLKCFNGIEFLSTLCFPKTKIFNEKDDKKYNSKKSDGVCLIDVRNNNGTLNIIPFILSLKSESSLFDRNFNHLTQAL